MYAGRLGDAEVRIDIQGVLPVLASLVRLTEGLAGAGQALVGTGLLVTIAGPACEGERHGVAVAGLGGLADCQQGLPVAVERIGFPAAVADLPVDIKRLLVLADGLVIVALPLVDLAEPGQHIGFDAPVADFAGQREGPSLMIHGLCVVALPIVDLTEVGKGGGLGSMFGPVAGHGAGLLEGSIVR